MSAAVAGCLLGVLLVLTASARSWVHVTDRSPAPTSTRPDAFVQTTAELGAGDVAAAAPALALVALAAVAAIAGTRGVARRMVGVIAAAAGAGAAAAAVRVLRDPVTAVSQARTADAVAVAGADELVAARAVVLLAVAGGGLIVAAGAATAAYGARWPALGRRYDAPAGREGAPTDPAPDRDAVATWDETDADDAADGTR